MSEPNANAALIREDFPDSTVHRTWHQQSTTAHVAYLIDTAREVYGKAAKRVSSV